MMSEGEVIFNLLYLLFMFGLLYPPQEFISAGKYIISMTFSIER